MSSSADLAIRRASDDDVAAIGRLLNEFNTEYAEPTPEPGQIAARMRDLMASGDTAVLLGGAGPDGLAVLRFRPSIWTQSQECYLAELYVVPARRGRGLGRALLDAAIVLAREHGADYMDLNTAETDVAARALYESVGFRNREGKPDGPINFYYELNL